MLRIAAIAYLSLTTVLGPSLCCCNVRQFLSLVAKSGGHCCGKPATKVSASTHKHSHKHHHCHQHVADHHCETPVPDNGTPQTPCDHDNKNCPCGNRQAKLVATATAVGTNVQTIEWHSQFFNYLATDLSVLPEFDLKDVSTTAHARPGDLFGREMLRAYKTLRC